MVVLKPLSLGLVPLLAILIRLVPISEQKNCYQRFIHYKRSIEF